MHYKYIPMNIKVDERLHAAIHEMARLKKTNVSELTRTLLIAELNRYLHSGEYKTPKMKTYKQLMFEMNASEVCKEANREIQE